MKELQLSTDVLTECAQRLAERFETEMCGKLSYENFVDFCENLRIPSAIGNQRFGHIVQDFQRERFTQIAPSLEAVSRGYKPPISRFWWEATKGASKDADIAVCLLWLLCASRRTFHCQVGAGDLAQAGIVKRRLESLLRINTHITDVEVIQYKVINTKTRSEIEIIPADKKGAHGAIPDVTVLNELSHVDNKEFFETMMDNAEKVPHGIVIIATNAGYKGTWHWTWRQQAFTSDRWATHVWNRPAPWIPQEAVEDAEKRSSQSRYRRLWLGEWSSGSGDALDENIIRAAVNENLQPMSGHEQGYWFTIGVDLGVTQDHAGVVVLGSRPHNDHALQKIRVAYARHWEPSTANGQVDLVDVLNTIYGLAIRFKARSVRYDPYQAALMAQTLASKRIVMQEVTFAGKNLTEMANVLLETFRDKKIEMYYDRHLINDLLKLVIVEKSYGYRLDAVRDEEGHADVATAMAIALPEAARLLKMPYRVPDLSLLSKFKSNEQLAARLDAAVEQKLLAMSVAGE